MNDIKKLNKLEVSTIREKINELIDTVNALNTEIREERERIKPDTLIGGPLLTKEKKAQDVKEEEWISLVQHLMDSGFEKKWAIRQAGPPPREGLGDEV